MRGFMCYYFIMNTLKSKDTKAYGKINLSLRIVGERADGYHEIESFMQSVDIYDDGRVKLVADKRHEIRIRGMRMKPEKNIAYKAAAAMREAFGIGDSVEIEIVKRLPVAAGMAGGSADCAAVLSCIGDLCGIKDAVKMNKIAASLGADVAFCLAVQKGIPAASCSGIGEIISAAKPMDYHVLIATPDIYVPTKDVYKELRPGEFSRPGEAFAFCNDLAAPALRLYPEIQNTMDALKQIDSPVKVQLSGSGPTVFALYDHKPSIAEKPEGLRFFELTRTRI